MLKHFTELDLSNLDIKTKTVKKREYLDIESAFDIETTSTYVHGEKTAFMYIWMWGIGDDDSHIYYGRTWQEFTGFMKQVRKQLELHEDRILITYVQNLGYEFQFIKKLFKWENVFSISERKPIKANMKGIEFRDSYILSGFSLAKIAENLQHHTIDKMVGDLDYSLIRHSETELTDKEMGYAKNDILIILYYIKEQRMIYSDITKIPLTNTGRVRQRVKNNCYFSNTNHRKSSGKKYNAYRKIMGSLTLEVDEYKMLKRAFIGGFTHANAFYTGKTIEDVHSIDFTSSYPAVMLTEQFPMSEPTKVEITKLEDFEQLCRNYCVLFNVRFTNLRAKVYQDNYISESKCFELEQPVINNGRVFSANKLSTTLTDIDYSIMKECYEWDKMEVADVQKFTRGYLPKPILESVIDMYQEKTTLKGVAGSEVEYLLSKGMLNSVYGMAVTDIVREDISYDELGWHTEPADEEEQIDKYNDSRNRFLYYAWGVWITAYARRNLWYGILAMGEDYIYSDTDSIKFKNYEKHEQFIVNYNKLVFKKLRMVSRHYGFNMELFSPKTIEGEEKPIGVWDYEGNYTKFKTLGAKRYLVEHDNGTREITVAGLPKRAIGYMEREFPDVFEAFNNELYIPATETGKSTHTYIDDTHECLITDYLGKELVVVSYGGVHLEQTDFTLNISVIYEDFIYNMIKGYRYEGVSVVG